MAAAAAANAAAAVAFGLLLLASVHGVELPYGAVNLDKNGAYLSSLRCLQNQTVDCPPNALNQSGKISVSAADQPKLCAQPCMDHINLQLQCINKSTRYGQVAIFRFGNKFLIEDLMSSLRTGCTLNGTGSYGNFSAQKPSNDAPMARASLLTMVAGVMACIVLVLAL